MLNSVVQRSQAVLGATHPDTLSAKVNYAETLTHLKRPKAAHKIYTEIITEAGSSLSCAEVKQRAERNLSNLGKS